MPKKEYKFNPQTFTYEVVTAPFRVRTYRLLRQILVGFILASVLNFLFSFFFYTPKMYRISRENNELLLQYDVLRDKITAATRKIEEIKHRDNSVYRSLFAADTLSIDGVYTPYPDSKYAPMAEDHYGPVMISAWKQLDRLGRMLYLESRSLDQLQTLALDKEKMSAAIPAIWPIDKKLFGNKHIGAFGGRYHPITHRWRPHTGIDFGGRKGDPIYATGDGVVEAADSRLRGYGKQIVINHGFGYKTRYAHLSKFLVEPGQTVRRGEQIAEMGSTGASTGTHLHYEVIYLGQYVNPINYFRQDMDQKEFERIIESAKATTYETD